MEFLEKMFQLYEQMMVQEVAFFNASGFSLTFKNMISLGIKLKKPDWTDRVIRKYGPYLPEKSRHSVMNFAQASVQFSRGQFSQAQKLLLDVRMIDSYYRLNYDLLLLKIFYECGEAESLLARIRAFTTFIHRNRSISDQNKEAYLNMAKILKRFARYSFDGVGKKETIRKLFTSTEYMVERVWLTEKFEALR